MSGSLVAWKIVPAVSETWGGRPDWIFGRVLSHLPSVPPHERADEALRPAQLSTTARHCSSVP